MRETERKSKQPDGIQGSGEAAGRLLIIGDAQYPDYKMTIRKAVA